MTKIALVIESFNGGGMGGGFFWWPDTPDNRSAALTEGRKDAADYANVVVLTCVLKVPGDSLPEDITDLLDEELAFESGRVGNILFKSFTEAEEAA